MTTPTKPLALVTGASSGIGLELADQFARHGHDLLIAADDASGLSTAAHRLTALGAQVTEVVGDLRRGAEVERLAAAVGDRPLDALVLDAGIGAGGAFVEQDLADVLSVVDLDVRSTVHLARLLLPAMVERGRAGCWCCHRSLRRCPARTRRSTTRPSRSCSPGRRRCSRSCRTPGSR